MKSYKSFRRKAILSCSATIIFTGLIIFATGKVKEQKIAARKDAEKSLKASQNYVAMISKSSEESARLLKENYEKAKAISRNKDWDTAPIPSDVGQPISQLENRVEASNESQDWPRQLPSNIYDQCLKAYEYKRKFGRSVIWDTIRNGVFSREEAQELVLDMKQACPFVL